MQRQHTQACEATTTPLANAALVPEARWLIDRYEFLAELGRGGMGIVYLARERSTGREVAIKLLGSLHAGNSDAALRFAREARTAAALEHPNIVRTLAIEELSPGAIALVSEYVPGETLRMLLHRTGPLPFAQTAAVMRDVAAALAHAHSSRIVHRDVKPENIFIEQASGRALLADFGIARPLDTDTQLTAAGSALGTPSYMAPEQVQGGRVDERADVYSLGLVGWEMLTGARPWKGETLYDVLHKQQHERLPSLAALRPDIPMYLLVAIEGALAKNPRERWSGGAELLERLTPTPAMLPVREPRDERSWANAETMPFVDSERDTPEASVPLPQQDAPAVAPVVDEAPTLESLPAGGVPVQPRESRIGVRGPLLTALAAAVVAMIALGGGKQFLRNGLSRVTSARSDSAMPSQVIVRDTASGRLASDAPAKRPDTNITAPVAPPVATPPVAKAPVVEPPVAKAPVAKAPVARPPVAKPPVAKPPVATRSAPASIADARCGTPTRSAQRACLLAEIDRNDADLTRTYRALIAQLRREAGGVREPPTVEALRVEQRAWIVRRDNACRSTPDAGSGPLWGAERAPCFARMSAERDTELQRRLQRRLQRTARDS